MPLARRLIVVPNRIQESCRKVGLSLFIFTIFTAMTGCGSDAKEEIIELKSQVKVLEAEKKLLKARIGGLDETGKALSEMNQQMLQDISATLAICKQQTPSNPVLEAQLNNIMSTCNSTSDTLQDVLSGIKDSRGPTPVSDPTPDSTPDPTPNPTPSPTPNPTPNPTPDPNPAPKDDTERQMLLGAYLACQYYSAGSCDIIMVAVGLELGMSSDEVRSESTRAWQDATEDLKNRSFEIPGPDGETIVIDKDILKEVHDAKTAILSMSEADSKSPCKVIATLSSTDLWKRLRIRDRRLPSFANSTRKKAAVELAEQVNMSLASVIGEIPVDGENTMTCQ